MARQNFVGLVVSQGKMLKTVKVRVETKVFNKRINKELFSRKDYLVHDEESVSREGDLVRIEATRPLSKRKFFSVAEIIKNKGQQFAQFESQAKTQVLQEEAQKSQEFLARRQNLEESDNVLLKDIYTIQDALSQGRDAQDLVEIKARYGIENFTPESLRQLLQLDVSALEKDVAAQKSKIDTVQARVRELLQDDQECDSWLTQRGVESPEALKPSIKRNLLRKYVLQEI
ncbi:LANO_0E02762g1_1 [Lachancea nothofagi CBS 11611]|uniref:LANO_0E02762g1_1 n=1 Tax=Lachancea nothofagi CBS 11611 TaxID=1266666 RepID=A0A1G4JQF7_9SACH|nr:LANO_0E02762g1_1 [Lachancea nothofagi CBS 11611]